MAEGKDAAPIIKRVRKVSGHAHHGGAWKVAYADFVTAMMAFFLLLWLLNATTDEQKRGISNYFAPSSVSDNNSGGGGVLGGTTLTAEGAMPSAGGSPMILLGPQPPGFGEADAEEEGRTDSAPAGRDRSEQRSADRLDEEELREAAARAEQQEFERTAVALREAIASSPELEELKNSLIVEQTQEGLRIQMVDQTDFAMFPIGSSRMDPRARVLLQKIAEAIARLPNRISVSGHTDATPYATDRGYSNWELSSDRANASRRVLVELGIDESRITRVVGRADTEPLVPEKALSPRNRRISITLLRRAES